MDLSLPEVAVIAIVALLVLGPERLPGAARTAGALLRRAQRSWSGLRADIERELAADELKRQLRETREAAGFDTLRRDLEQAQADIGHGLEQARSDVGCGLDVRASAGGHGGATAAGADVGISAAVRTLPGAPAPDVTTAAGATGGMPSGDPTASSLPPVPHTANPVPGGASVPDTVEVPSDAPVATSVTPPQTPRDDGRA
jgi:sec-independent protein translocase protein TatB